MNLSNNSKHKIKYLQRHPKFELFLLGGRKLPDNNGVTNDVFAQFLFVDFFFILAGGKIILAGNGM